MEERCSYFNFSAYEKTKFQFDEKWIVKYASLKMIALIRKLCANQGSQTRGHTCSPRERFVRPTILFGNFEIINI